MKYLKLHAIVLNRRTVGDSDRFLTLYSLELGKLDVFARSVRSLKSKRSASLDMFSHIACEVIEKNDHRTLTHVDLIETHSASKTNLNNISRLFTIGELVDKLTPEEDPHPAVYDLLVTALSHLHRFDTPEYLTRFKKKLLQELGFDPNPANLDSYIDSLLTHPLRTRQIL